MLHSHFYHVVHRLYEGSQLYNNYSCIYQTEYKEFLTQKGKLLAIGPAILKKHGRIIYHPAYRK